MIPFVKAHACGNDFLVVQENLAGLEARDALTRRLCHRNQGIGADGVEFLTWENVIFMIEGKRKESQTNHTSHYQAKGVCQCIQRLTCMLETQHALDFGLGMISFSFELR